MYSGKLNKHAQTNWFIWAIRQLYVAQRKMNKNYKVVLQCKYVYIFVIA